MFCRSCGSPMSDGAKFCPKCGMQTAKKLQNATQQTAQNTAQQPQSAAEKFKQSYQQGKQKGQQLFGNKSAKSAQQAAPQQQYTQQQYAQPQQQYAQPQYAQQPQYNATGAAGKKAVKSAAKAAGKTGAKAGLGFAAKAALVGAVGIAVVGGASTVLNNGDGGGGHTPPVDPPGYEQGYNNPGGGENTYTNNPSSGGGSENTGTYTGGGYTSAQEGQNFTRFWMQTAGFPTENGQPRLRGGFYIIERDAATGKAYFWENKREGEPDSSWDYDPNTGTITIPDDDPNLTMRLTLNPDGSLTDGVTDIVEVENGSVREGAYVKFTGLTSEDGVNWTVPSTGEAFKQDEFGYTSAMSDSLAISQFKEEAMAWARANGVTIQYSEPEEEEKPTYNPTPSVDTSNVALPDDVLQTYVVYELENIHHEYYGVHEQHLKMPNAASQKRFEELIREKLYGPELDFWLANKDSW